MCGIVGLHLRSPELYPRLGALLTGMLVRDEDRGPDSAGIAVYGDPTWSPAGQATVSLLELDASTRRTSPHALGAELGVAGRRCRRWRTTTSCTPTSTSRGPAGRGAERATRTCLVIGFGDDLAVLKGVGNPVGLAEAFGLPQAQGWQGVAHTRMATESAVTAGGAHPFSVGPDQCLVHNGSFSNHATHPP